MQYQSILVNQSVYLFGFLQFESEGFTLQNNGNLLTAFDQTVSLQSSLSKPL